MDARQEKLLRRTFLDYQSTAEFMNNPLIVSRAEGLYYWDTDGKRYFDGISGIYSTLLGHRHPRVEEAMRAQWDKLAFAPPMHGTADVTLDCVEKLGSVMPGDLNYVKAFSGGSESMEAAIKFTRQYFKLNPHLGGCAAKKQIPISNSLSVAGRWPRLRKPTCLSSPSTLPPWRRPSVGPRSRG